MTSTTDALTFPEQLKSITSESHQKLENLPVSISITLSSVTREEYSHYLNLMHSVIATTENKIFPIIASIITDLDQRSKIKKLESDLNVLDSKIENLKPVFDSFPNTLPFALGIMYVIEGSSLGGRYILKNIESALGFSETNGAQYFAGYGNKTGSSWKIFMKMLTDYEIKNGNSKEIIAGAEYAFREIHHLFSEI